MSSERKKEQTSILSKSETKIFFDNDISVYQDAFICHVCSETLADKDDALEHIEDSIHKSLFKEIIEHLNSSTSNSDISTESVKEEIDYESAGASNESELCSLTSEELSNLLETETRNQLLPHGIKRLHDWNSFICEICNSLKCSKGKKTIIMTLKLLYKHVEAKKHINSLKQLSREQGITNIPKSNFLSKAEVEEGCLICAFQFKNKTQLITHYKGKHHEFQVKLISSTLKLFKIEFERMYRAGKFKEMKKLRMSTFKLEKQNQALPTGINRSKYSWQELYCTKCMEEIQPKKKNGATGLDTIYEHIYNECHIKSLEKYNLDSSNYEEKKKKMSKYYCKCEPEVKKGCIICLTNFANLDDAVLHYKGREHNNLRIIWKKNQKLYKDTRNSKSSESDYESEPNQEVKSTNDNMNKSFVANKAETDCINNGNIQSNFIDNSDLTKKLQNSTLNDIQTFEKAVERLQSVIDSQKKLNCSKESLSLEDAVIRNKDDKKSENISQTILPEGFEVSFLSASQCICSICWKTVDFKQQCIDDHIASSNHLMNVEKNASLKMEKRNFPLEFEVGTYYNSKYYQDHIQMPPNQNTGSTSSVESLVEKSDLNEPIETQELNLPYGIIKVRFKIEKYACAICSCEVFSTARIEHHTENLNYQILNKSKAVQQLYLSDGIVRIRTTTEKYICSICGYYLKGTARVKKHLKDMNHIFNKKKKLIKNNSILASNNSSSSVQDHSKKPTLDSNDSSETMEMPPSTSQTFEDKLELKQAIKLFRSDRIWVCSYCNNCKLSKIYAIKKHLKKQKHKIAKETFLASSQKPESLPTSSNLDSKASNSL